MENLRGMFDSLQGTVGNALPGVFGALILLLIGFLIASILKRIVVGVLGRTQLDEKLSKKMNVSFRIDQLVGKLVYYLVLLFVLLLVLDMLGVNNVLEPLKDMLSKFLGYIPNIIAAGIIGFIGYVIATIASEATGFIAGRIETLSEKMGWKDPVALTKLVKQLVFVFVFIPILIIALDKLDMDVITVPATNMLNSLMSAIPKIIAAGIIVGVFYIVGKFVVGFLTDLLRNLGTDEFANNMGFSSMIGKTPASKFIGNIAFFFIMFAGILSAADKLEMASISNILEDIFEITGRILFGLFIMGIGVFIANKVQSVMGSNKDNQWLASVARFAILGIFGAIALSTMGIADDIVNLAFGLTLGAIAVAFALSFGLGGREAAGKAMEDFLGRFRKNS